MQEQEKNITQSDIKKTYSFYAPIYDFVFGAVLEPGRKALAMEVSVLKPGTILEIGVGTGLLLDKYPSSSQIFGIDISDDMLNIARQRTEKIAPSIQLQIMDAEQLQFADHSFDCVVVPYVLSVTPNPHTLIKEIRRVCRKGGTIIILNHFSGNNAWLFLEKLFKNLAEKIGFRSEFSYEIYISAYGWQINKVKSVNLFGLSKLVVIKNN